jgi:NIMA (never in mitosis gene a)-related kinase
MNEEEKSDAIQEGKILEQLDHPNIIKFREVYIEKSANKQILHIVMDYADGGDLQQRIKTQKGKYFSENSILDWFTQICLAIKHIHDRKILHRDIKSQNIFLTKNGLVKLGDFGIAKCLNMTIDKAKTIVGTPYYLSPEIVQNRPYSFKSDIWSLGVLLYEMCALKMPFDAQSLPLLSLKIIKCSYGALPPNFSKDMRSLINTMLNVDINKRPSINQILSINIIIKHRSSFYQI